MDGAGFVRGFGVGWRSVSCVRGRRRCRCVVLWSWFGCFRRRCCCVVAFLVAVVWGCCCFCCAVVAPALLWLLVLLLLWLLLLLFCCRRRVPVVRVCFLGVRSWSTLVISKLIATN